MTEVACSRIHMDIWTNEQVKYLIYFQGRFYVKVSKLIFARYIHLIFRLEPNLKRSISEEICLKFVKLILNLSTNHLYFALDLARYKLRCERPWYGTCSCDAMISANNYWNFLKYQIFFLMLWFMLEIIFCGKIY